MEDKIYCEACAELRADHPNLIANGFNDHNCESLSHDLGLDYDGDPSAFDEHTEALDDASLHNKDCEDLNTMNDCLIGSMADEAEISGMCGWQDYMKKFVPNMWTMFKALICAICGIWDQIWDVWDYAKSYTLTKSGNRISLTARDGNHGTVIDDNTTYSLSKSGSTITLTGSDGSKSSVEDSDTITPDTKYGMSWDSSRNELKLAESANNKIAFKVHRTLIVDTTISAGDVYERESEVPMPGYKLIGVLGFNISNGAGGSGSSKLNVYAVEPATTQDNTVWLQFRNLNDHSVDCIVYVTLLYVKI